MRGQGQRHKEKEREGWTEVEYLVALDDKGCVCVCVSRLIHYERGA